MSAAAGTRHAVVGAGAWGTTLAMLLAERADVTLVARSRARVPEGGSLPARVSVLTDLGAVAGADGVVVFALPSAAMRSVAVAVAPHLSSDAAVLSVAKGIETPSLARMSEVLTESLGIAPGRVAALSGPNLAGEVARGLPAAAVVAATEPATADRVVEALGRDGFRLYRNADIVGVELAGALKNIVAIVAGAVEAIGAGDNGKAAIVTRGLAEITRLGVAMGADPLTFGGLAGIGDILATCTSPLSRNHQLGMALASGRSLEEATADLAGVAEGAYTVRAAVALADRHDVEMPLSRAVHAVLYEGKSVPAALADLLARQARDELAGLA